MKLENNIKDMKARHEREIEELQNNCKHPEVSDWLEEWWAISHPTGMRVRTCELCEEEIDREVHCFICKKLMTGYNWKEHIGEYYCTQCAPDWKKLRKKKFDKLFENVEIREESN